MPDSKTVSVVLATYNGAKYLREQLDSILQQTLLPNEIIIQDDCSSDESIEIIRQYLTKLPIILDINPHNLGYLRNFELAISKASCDYIAPCDQDDIWEADKLELLLNTIGNNALIYSNSLLIDSEGNSLGQTFSDKLKNRFISTSSPLSFVYDNCVSAHALLFHRTLLPQIFPFPQYLYFDAWIAANASTQGGISYIDQPLVRYRQHATNTLSIMQKKSRSLSEKIALKSSKKVQEHNLRSNIIADLLRIDSLSDNDRDLLEQLKSAHISFHTKWFNLQFFYLLVHNRAKLFAITTRNPYLLAFKKAIGFKLYRLFPFL